MAPESSALKKGARVIVIDDLPGVVAGTAGRVGRSIGIKTVRYRVQFENGINALSVAESKLVSPAAWEFIKEQQIAVPQSAPVSSPAAASPSVAPSPPVTAPSPAVETTETSEPAADTPTSPSTASSDDPRLAALTAKSRDARKAAGVDVDAEVATEPTPTETQEQPSENPAPVSEIEEEPVEPAIELPDGYFPTDNRVADLLASVRER